MRRLLAILLFATALPGQARDEGESVDPWAQFPPVPPLSMYNEVLGFRAKVESMIADAGPQVTRADTLTSVVDRLVASWVEYGDYMDLEHGSFPNMSRNRPYWLVTTDDAADTLTDRLIPALSRFTRANPQERLGPIRAEWEAKVEQLGVPRGKMFGFQFVELARRAGILRREMAAAYPGATPDLNDAFIRFLWDLAQFYEQQHSTWYDRHSMRIAQEDWIVHRTRARCEDPKWQILASFTAIGVDTSSTDYMTDKFMHRLVLVDPACPDTVDFLMPLPHHRLMEKEIMGLTPTERDSLMRGLIRAAELKSGGARPGEGAR